MIEAPDDGFDWDAYIKAFENSEEVSELAASLTPPLEPHVFD
jgi:hypothetical protein